MKIVNKSGGIGAELSGGNFWQGAVTGGIVAGLNSAMHKMQQGKKEETYENKLRKRLKELKKGDVINGKELNILDDKASLAIKNIEKISNNQYKVNRTLTGSVVIDKNTILTINADGAIGNHKGILITKTGSKPFRIEYKSGETHTYNTLLLKENRIYYKYNNKIYSYSIK